jgi:hypothetical protein
MGEDRDPTRAPAPLCPMCRRPLSPTDPSVEEPGWKIHVGCDLGLADAGGAIARLLQERPGHGLCIECIARALSITPLEAETGSGRLRPLRGFDIRFDRCVGCGARRQVVRALRADLRRSTRDSRTA